MTAWSVELMDVTRCWFLPLNSEQTSWLLSWAVVGDGGWWKRKLTHRQTLLMLESFLWASFLPSGKYDTVGAACEFSWATQESNSTPLTDLSVQDRGQMNLMHTCNMLLLLLLLGMAGIKRLSLHGLRLTLHDSETVLLTPFYVLS